MITPAAPFSSLPTFSPPFSPATIFLRRHYRHAYFRLMPDYAFCSRRDITAAPYFAVYMPTARLPRRCAPRRKKSARAQHAFCASRCAMRTSGVAMRACLLIFTPLCFAARAFAAAAATDADTPLLRHCLMLYFRADFAIFIIAGLFSFFRHFDFADCLTPFSFAASFSLFFHDCHCHFRHCR